MRKLIVTEFVTLDGVMEAPEQWVFEFHTDETARLKLDEMLHADALILGKNTYDIFASSWPSMSGELADKNHLTTPLAWPAALPPPVHSSPAPPS